MLTCPSCQAPLYPHLVRRTDDGWRHVRCPRIALARLAALAAERKAAERLEDLRWMADTGETLTGAAERLGIPVKSLEKWCSRNNARDIFHTLAHREHGVAVWRPNSYARRRVS